MMNKTKVANAFCLSDPAPQMVCYIRTDFWPVAEEENKKEDQDFIKFNIDQQSKFPAK